MGADRRDCRVVNHVYIGAIQGVGYYPELQRKLTGYTGWHQLRCIEYCGMNEILISSTMLWWTVLIHQVAITPKLFNYINIYNYLCLASQWSSPLRDCWSSLRWLQAMEIMASLNLLVRTKGSGTIPSQEMVVLRWVPQSINMFVIRGILSQNDKADSVFSGISTFGRLPYFPCLSSDAEKYDIAFLG
jgi:hypothetical protein